MLLQDILMQLDIDTILVANNGDHYSPDNLLDHVVGDRRQYALDGVGIWMMDDNGYRQSVPVYKLETSVTTHTIRAIRELADCPLPELKELVRILEERTEDFALPSAERRIAKLILPAIRKYASE